MTELVALRSRRAESVSELPRSLMSRLSTGHLVMTVAGVLTTRIRVAVAARLMRAARSFFD